MIFGFSSEFNLKRKLTENEQEKLMNPFFFKLADGNSGSISMLSGQRLKVSVNKYYTVFAQFAGFRETQTP